MFKDSHKLLPQKTEYSNKDLKGGHLKEYYLLKLIKEKLLTKTKFFSESCKYPEMTKN